MKTFIVEILDRATCITAIATVIGTSHALGEYESAAMGKAGFRGEYVLLTTINDMKTHYDSRFWGGRTVPTAHQWMCDNPEKLVDGLVLDVEYILGEVDYPKSSDIYVE